MSDSNVQPLEKISSEVIESEFKIILSSQCIKAQAFLVQKLKKQSEQTKQICTFISNGNFKLVNEIKLGELEVKSLLSALETIQSANVELKKELLLSKEERNELTERVESGIKKYEELWIQSKKRYDNIPVIKEKLQIQSKGTTLEKNINSLGLEIEHFMEVLVKKKTELNNLNKRNIINVAEYMTNERPKLLQYVNEKKKEINNLKKEINELQDGHEDNYTNPLKLSSLKETNDTTMDVSACVMENITNNNNNETALLPKLQLQNIDLDILIDKLKQIRKADYDSPLIKRVDFVSDIQNNNLENNNIFVSSNLKTSTDEDVNKDTHQKINYSEKKLIHILEDVQICKKDTFNIFSNLNRNEFQDVNTIKAEFHLNTTQPSPEKIDCSMEVDQNEVIEEVDLTRKESSNNNSTINILVPPTQFLDFSQGNMSKSSQKCDEDQMNFIERPKDDSTITKNAQEKKVTFDTVLVQDVDKNNTNMSQEITSSPLNISLGIDDSYNEIKNNIFKKHNLESSPKFTYLKNPVVPKVYNTSVTSKFFEVTDNTNDQEVEDFNSQTIDSKLKPQENIHVKQVHDSSVADFLFSHGPKGLTELLDVSITSPCIDDSDDFSHCIDSTLLLSPKSDLPASVDKNAKELSQEPPNFLSGFRKVGFSFFGNSSSEKKSDSNNKNSDFNFNFSSTEKKSRGGLFNLFN